MSIKSINESFKRLYESEMEELPIEDEFTELEISLRNTVDTLIDNNELHIKKFEIAIQDVLENFFPEQSWWEITEVNVFMDLFNYRDPYGTVDRILKDLRGEEDIEESLNEARNYDNLEINDKIAKALSRKSFAKKYEKELNDLGIEVEYLDGQGTALIGPNGKKLSSSRNAIFGPSAPGFNDTHHKPYVVSTRWEENQVAYAKEKLNKIQELIDNADTDTLSYKYPRLTKDEAINELQKDFEKAKIELELAINRLKREIKDNERSRNRARRVRRDGQESSYIGRTHIDDKVDSSPVDYLTYLTKPVSSVREQPNIHTLDYGPGTPNINRYKNLNRNLDSAKSYLEFDKRYNKILEPNDLQAAIDELEAEFNRKVQNLIDSQEKGKKSIAKSYDKVAQAEKAKDDYLKSLGIR